MTEQSEEEFLKSYDPSVYKHPSVAVDCLVFRGDKLLLVRRGGHPYKGRLALPGGFIEENESAEQAVRRELKEETGLNVEAHRFCFDSTPGRDPRDWNISLVFYAFDNDGKVESGDDAADADFFDVALCGNTLVLNGEKIELDIKTDVFGDLDFDATKIIKDEVLAFDHAKIIAAALISGVFNKKDRKNG